MLREEIRPEESGCEGSAERGCKGLFLKRVSREGLVDEVIFQKRPGEVRE